MLLVKNRLGKSRIHGLGVFALEPIRKGRPVWRFVDGFDRCWTPAQFARLPKQARDYLQVHGYSVDGEILLPADNDHHMNHSDDANTHWHRGCIRARRNIAKGEEITNNYRELDLTFCAAFLAPKDKTNRRKKKKR